MAAITQKGTALKIGFANHVYTGYLMKDLSLEPTGDQDEVRDEDNANITVLVSNLGTQISFNAVILGTGSLTPPALGSSLTVNNVVYRTLSSAVKMQAKEAMLSFSGVKEASMTYT